MSPQTKKAETNKAWHLYVIECKGERLYTGIAVDIDARFQAHLSGKGAKFTKAFPPERLLFTLQFENRPAASKAEYDFKTLSASEKRRFIADHAPEEKP
jgi:putative endonuclease